ncbi:hypothetical protein ZWY2020_031889 [Hordeum vulgare]|nr:hypothetical protein ZWY2020_031889 [Hordeum vulgare]
MPQLPATSPPRSPWSLLKTTNEQPPDATREQGPKKMKETESFFKAIPLLVMAPASMVMSPIVVQDGGIATYAVCDAAPSDDCCGGRHRKAESDGDDNDDDYDCAPA